MWRLAAAAVLVAVACLNEAEAAGTRLVSMHEAMGKTTLESAVDLLFRKHKHHQHPRAGELVSLIQEKFGQRKGMLRSERVISRHGSKEHATTAPPTGYAAASGATAMLNDMIAETNNKLTLEQQKCRHFNMSTLSDLASARASVAEFNSQANAARSRVLKASAAITTLSTNQQETREQLRKHKRECAEQLDALNKELAIVVADLDVMRTILQMTECGDDAAAAASFFQMGAQVSVSSTALVSCRHCNRGRGMVMLQDSKLQHMLYKLRSSAAHTFLSQHLQLSFQEASQKFKPVALTEVAAAHMRRLASSARLHRRLRRDDANLSESRGLLRDDNVSDGVNISQVPEEPVPYDCTPTDKCTLSEGNCQNLKDRFLLVAAGISDKKDELTAELAKLEDYCNEQERVMKEQLEFLEGRIAEEQGNLATATGEQNQAESGSKLKAEEFDSLSDEYGEEMGKCCDNHNALISEQCALVKIRGELEKLQGVTVFITDCEVSDWSYEACDKSCGGGNMKMTRSVLVHPNGGMECPALEAFDLCNIQACPVDCVVEEWGGWSSCSAECDGGTQSRQRAVRVAPSDGGEECGDLTETASCNLQACNKDCVLADWSEWTDCSKYCDLGHSRRHREIAEPAVGTGTCPFPDLPERLQFQTCNPVTCDSLLPTPDTIVKCKNKVDIVVLLDGSGSLGSYGWVKSRNFAKKLIANLEGGDDFVKVALMLFSGPRTWADYYECISSDPNVQVDMENQCSIRWVKEFTNETAEVSKMVGNLDWPAASTLTSVALAETEAMLVHGREEAETLVIVITDGRPISDIRTKAAAEKLKQSARLLWVPVGNYAPLDMIEELASLPKEDHVVKVDQFFQLDTPTVINDVLATSCNNLEIPPLVES